MSTEGLEGLLAEALLSADPAAAFQKAASNEDLSEATRAIFRQIDGAGARIAGLLVVRLRFERLLQGSDEAAGWYEEDPAAFAEAFRQYHAEVRPTAFSPPEEAKLFAGWRALVGASGAPT